MDRSERPYSPDHLSELSYDEARALLRARGFTILEESGLHLELLLNWLSPLPKLDRLQRKWNRSWAVPLMRVLLAAGALAPGDVHLVPPAMAAAVWALGPLRLVLPAS